MVCAGCGHRNPDDAVFCAECGSRMVTEGAGSSSSERRGSGRQPSRPMRYLVYLGPVVASIVGLALFKLIPITESRLLR